MNVLNVIYIIIGCVFVIGAIVIQIICALSEHKYLGYILPFLFIVITIIYLFKSFDVTMYYGYVNIFLNWLKCFLLYNIPSIIMILVYEIINKYREK